MGGGVPVVYIEKVAIICRIFLGGNCAELVQAQPNWKIHGEVIRQICNDDAKIHLQSTQQMVYVKYTPDKTEVEGVNL